MNDALARMQLQLAFPRLGGTQFAVTSDQTPSYNCIAWAAGDDQRFWWPGVPPLGGYYWPPSLTAAVTLENFRKAYELEGFVECVDASIEVGIEKLAIYTLNGVPTHAARQLPDGKWTSKCGQSYDISHDTPGDVGGGTYGEVEMYMSRKKSP